MRQALAATAVPEAPARAEQVWSDYSERWQVYNQIRTVAGFLSLGLAAAALVLLGRGRTASQRG